MAEASINLNFNMFDILVYLTLFLAAAISLYRGFIAEFLSFVTWFGAGLITLALADNTTAFMTQYMTSYTGAAIVGTLGTYFLIVVIFASCSRVLLRYLKDGADVGWVDNVLGVFFGLFKGGMVIVLGFILMAAIFKEEGYPEWVRTASTLPTVQSFSLSVASLLPDYLGNVFVPVESTTPVDGFQQPVNTQQIDQGLQQEFSSTPAPPPENAPTALEQLIMDVTDDQPQGAF